MYRLSKISSFDASVNADFHEKKITYEYQCLYDENKQIFAKVWK